MSQKNFDGESMEEYYDRIGWDQLHHPAMGGSDYQDEHYKWMVCSDCDFNVGKVPNDLVDEAHALFKEMWLKHKEDADKYVEMKNCAK